MKPTRRIFAAIGLVLVASATPRIATETNPAYEIHGATAAETELVDWAIGRFAIADLPLPRLTIRFHRTLDGCRGYIGYFSEATGTVDICNRGGLKTEKRHTLLHELAHAWKFSHLTEEQMAAWTERRDLETWNSHDDAWWQRGQEQAAEIVAWGLVDQPMLVSWIQLERCADLAADFEALTGRVPLNDFTDSCQD